MWVLRVLVIPGPLLTEGMGESRVELGVVTEGTRSGRVIVTRP